MDLEKKSVHVTKPKEKNELRRQWKPFQNLYTVWFDDVSGEDSLLGLEAMRKERSFLFKGFCPQSHES